MLLQFPEQAKVFDYDSIPCPVCHDEHNHLGIPEKVLGYDSGEAWDGRGDMIRIPMECEQGCRWSICLGFHKGNVWGYYEVAE